MSALHSEGSTCSTSYSDPEIDALIAAVPADSPDPSPNTSVESQGIRVTAGSKRKAESLSPRPERDARYKRTRTEGDSDENSKPLIIAYSQHVQKCMDARRLAWGVQWEIARLVNSRKITWADVSPGCLDQLRGTCQDAAPTVERIFRPDVGVRDTSKPARISADELSARAPWKELDRESLAFSISDRACLGTEPLPAVFPPGWYGGKVGFAAKLVKSDKDLRLEILQPELSSSSRFTRRFGSDFIIRVRIHKEVFFESSFLPKLESLLSRPWVINGRVFRFFYANKERHAFLAATNETYDELQGIRCHPYMPRRMTLLDFLKWHNPTRSNSQQTMAKWASRFALGLSNSVPGILLDASHVRHIDEIISEHYSGAGKVPSEMEMTDGCGFINAAGLRALHKLEIWDRCPTAIQCRIQGAKGLLVLHPGKEENAMEKPCVWLRPSQKKIKYSSTAPLDPAQLTIDVLRASHMRTPVRLSKEMTICLAENGVPHEVFGRLLRDALYECVQSFINGWDDADGMPRLWRTVAKEGSVMAQRMARRATGLARVRGLRAFDDDDDDDDDEEEDSSSSSAWWEDEVSGCPSTLEETVLVFLDSGFRPDKNPILADKLRAVVKKAIARHLRYRIEVTMGCSAFIIPDPSGKLKPGQIHVKSSYHNLKMPNGDMTDRLTGTVLVTRNPVKLSRDVQKVEAVRIPELDDYVDVIVFSTQGECSLASLLGGGDYDGDTVEVIWQPDIVQNFTNADLELSKPPIDLMRAFKVENETVANFLQKLSMQIGETEAERIRAFQSVLMAPMREPSVVGTYSGLHDNAMYALGYNSPETVRLGYMFCTTLDGSKTGLSVLDSVFTLDKRRYFYQRAPIWKKKFEERKEKKEPKIDTSNQVPIPRGENLPLFIMDYLQSVVKHESDGQYALVEKFFKRYEVLPPDEVLERPYKLAKERIGRHSEPNQELMEAELSMIKEHVEECYRYHQDTMTGEEKFTELGIKERQDMLRDLSREFIGKPAENNLLFFSEEEVWRIRASYAYYYDYYKINEDGSRKWPTRFPWNVAMRTLSDIKSGVNHVHKTISPEFYPLMEVRKSAIS